MTADNANAPVNEVNSRRCASRHTAREVDWNIPESCIVRKRAVVCAGRDCKRDCCTVARRTEN